MPATLPLFAGATSGKPANILAAARALGAHLNRSRQLDRRLVSGVMTTSFGGSDAEGAWTWRDAYDAIEAAIVLQLRSLAPQISRLEVGDVGVQCLGRAPQRLSWLKRPWNMAFAPAQS